MLLFSLCCLSLPIQTAEFYEAWSPLPKLEDQINQVLTNSWPTLTPLPRGPNMWRLLILAMSILPYFTSLITNAPPRTYKAGLPFWLLFNSCSVVFRFKAPCSYDPLTVVYLYCHYDWVLFSWQFSVTCKANFFSYFNQNYVDSW